MNVLITGGTGFVGSRLVHQLTLEKHHVFVLTRFPKKHADTESISYISYDYPIKHLPFIHAVINLAGESLFGYWSAAKKRQIKESRVEVTEQLISLLIRMNEKPNVFLTASAMGYYGMSEEQIFTEATEQPGSDFLAQVCEDWEKAASTAEDLGIRTVYARFGIILDKAEGALPQIALPIKMGVGGKIGDGQQWMSWIHIEDCVNLLLFSLYETTMKGALNVTAPFPRQNSSFTKVLAKELKRPSIFTAPSSFFKIALGDMHQLITEGQFVYPQKALDTGFVFQYPQLENALEAVYNS
ncbi:MAG TPA: TIGR01777 family oxidoreductase [Pseudogracilibacillus sp.]|nr:TIGR01777 family oxidoreductase [Pseudogracilibacillus sp.]